MVIDVFQVRVFNFLPVLPQLLEVRSIPLGSQIDVLENFSWGIHLAKNRQHFLVDERFVLSQIYVQFFLQSEKEIFVLMTVIINQSVLYNTAQFM